MEFALLLRPFAIIVFFAAVVIPIKILIFKALPDSRFRDFLFKKRG